MTREEAGRLNGLRGGRPKKTGQETGQGEEITGRETGETGQKPDATGYQEAETGQKPEAEEPDAETGEAFEPVPEPTRICWPPGKRVPCWLGSPAWVQAYLSRPTVDMRSLAVEAEVPAAREPERAGKR